MGIARLNIIACLCFLLFFSAIYASTVSAENYPLPDIESPKTSLPTDTDSSCDEEAAMATSSATVSITSVSSSNCTGTDATGYTASWNIDFTVSSAPDNAISYQRNTDPVQNYTLSGLSGSLTIAGVPADGGVADTLKVWFTNDPSCSATYITNRPLPCPTTVGVPCVRNVALTGTATSSSVYQNNGPERAIDGNTNGVFANGDLFHSQNESLIWWQVDLNSTENIQSIVIYNRTDCCGDRLNNVILDVLDANDVSVFAYFITGVGNQVTVSVGGLNGRKVRLRRNGPIPFNFAEVEVFANTTCPAASGTICNSISNTEIKGSVWEDWNYDGAMNENTIIGVPGVQVSAYDCNGSLAATSYADANGNYQFTGLSTGQDYRIEFTLPESVSSWAQPTKAGADNGSTVQFVQPGNCANLGVAAPDEFCQSNPTTAIACYVAGGTTPGTPSGNAEGFVMFPYNRWGIKKNNPSYVGPDIMIPQAGLGSTWGTAYQRSSETIFASAFLTRHVGLDALGTGGIYKIDKAGNVTPFLDLNTLPGVNTGTVDRTGSNALPDTYQAPSYDYDAFGKIGKVGIGNMDMSADEKTLWAINLHDRTLLELFVDNPAVVPASATAHDIVAGFNALGLGCTNGEVRPFALTEYRGKVYVGLVCSAENGGVIADLHAYILEHDPNGVDGNFSQVLDFPLDFTRQCGGTYNPSCTLNWYPWVSTNSYPYISSIDLYQYAQPILSDIEFDEGGDLILGFMDRNASQYFSNNYNLDGNLISGSMTSVGDLLRACKVNGQYYIEGTTQCPFPNPGASNLGMNGGEYYWDDGLNRLPYFSHWERTQGGLAFLLGSGEVMTNTMDPYNNNSEKNRALSTGGLARYNNSTGARSLNTSYTLYAQGLNPGTASKGNGLGEPALLCDIAPVEIGNRVWQDDNGNGLQDACEVGVDGLSVKLYDRNGVRVAVTTTANGGQYYFNDTNVDTTGVWPVGTPKTAYSGMSRNTQYYIVFGEGQFTSGQFALNSDQYMVTPSANSGTNDELDSDVDGGILSVAQQERPGGLPFIGLITPNISRGDHKYDMGLVSMAACSVTAPTITGDQTVCEGQDPAAFTVSTPATGNGVLSYQWQSSTTNCNTGFADIAGATSATYDAPALTQTTYYRVVVSNNLICQEISNCLTITIGSDLTVSAGADVFICANETANLSATASGGDGNYTYTWDNGLGLGASHSFTGVASTTANSVTDYTVTITDGNGCTATDVVRVHVASTPNVTVSSNAAYCGQNNGSIVFSFTDHPSRAGMFFSIDNGATFPFWVNDADGSYTVSGLGAGVYNVAVRWGDGNCLVDLGTIAITDEDGPEVTASPDVTVCVGETVSLSASASGGTGILTYNWSTLGAGYSPTFTAVSSATYTVTVTDAEGCTSTDDVSVFVTNPPSVSAVATDEHCRQSDGAIMLTFSDNPNQTQISFSIDGGVSYPYTAQDNAGSFVISNLSAGTYDLWSSWNVGDCPVAVQTVSLSNLAGPTVTTSPDATVCEGEGLQISASASGGTAPYLYTWDNSLGNGAAKTVFPSSTTTYTVTATDNFGCRDLGAVTITVLPYTDPACSDCPDPADADGDGICASEDCDDNDPTLPLPLGTICDDGNPLTTNDVIVGDGCSCQGEYLPCTTTLSLNISQPVYNDNGTLGDATDDTFTFTIQINGNATGWTANGQSGTYGQTATFGPYAVDASGVTFDVVDNDNPNCRENVSVNISSCINSGQCTCCQ